MSAILRAVSLLAQMALQILAPLASYGAPPAAEVRPLAAAHAHNDYYHRRPLLDALDHGFCSVEADLFLVQGKLLVGHSWLELNEKRTLEAAYLDPLKKRVAANQGRVFADGPLFMLLVDIKSDGPEVYAQLREVLAEYKEMLWSVDNGKVSEGAVQVVISGACPVHEIETDPLRYVGIDGRPNDLDSKQPAHLMPLISDQWSSQFSWRGKGQFPAPQRDKLHKMVAQAHAKGRRVRFWATPENPAVWQELLAAGVDHLNTDKLARMRHFLIEREATKDAKAESE